MNIDLHSDYGQVLAEVSACCQEHLRILIIHDGFMTNPDGYEIQGCEFSPWNFKKWLQKLTLEN